jgi:hypothetical protein
VQNVPLAQKSFRTHPKVVLCDEALLEACFGLFGDSANFDARQVPSLRRKYHRLKNRFVCARWNSSVMWVLWNLVSVRLEMVLVSVQDKCTICAKRTIGLEIVLDAPDGTPR